MLTRIRKAKENGESGFTLIELLVVVVIIGILSAIAIPTFLKQREKAWDKAMKADLHNNALKMEEYLDDNNGAYPAAGTTTTGQYAFKLSDNVASVVIATKAADVTAGAFCIEATSSKLAATAANYKQHLRSTDGKPVDGAC